MTHPQASDWTGGSAVASETPFELTANVPPVVVIWMDWYAYHVARLRALAEHPALASRVVGIEMVGGCGVHGNLKFRSDDRGGLPIYTLLPDTDWKDAVPSALAKALWKKLNEINPAVLLIPGYYTLPAIAAALWGRIHGRITVLMTETTAEDHPRVWWKERLKQLLLRSLFDWAIAGGKPHRRYLQQLGFPTDRVASMYDVVDNEFFAQGIASCRATEKTLKHDLPAKYFLYVGRLAEEKNVGGLLRSFAAYRQQGGTWSLVIVGDGPLGVTLRKEAQDLNLANDVQFAGHKSSTETLPYYAGASCFVLPSTREPWGLVVNEAMAAALPVLVSRHCGCAEDLVENGRNGYVFDPAHPHELADRMREIASLSLAQREACGRASLEQVRRYSPQAWAEEVARVAKG